MTFARSTAVVATLATLAATACTTQITSTEVTPDAPIEPPAACAPARSYAGFGGLLEAGRSELAAGTDRLRLKPYDALAPELRRVLGLTTFSTADYAATIGKPPERWYAEPAANASALQGTFMVAFEACFQHWATRDAPPPRLTTAEPYCRELSHAAWDRDATDAQVAACATFVVDHTPIVDSNKRRWAYACAAILIAPGFLAY